MCKTLKTYKHMHILIYLTLNKYLKTGYGSIVEKGLDVTESVSDFVFRWLYRVLKVKSVFIDQLWCN